MTTTTHPHPEVPLPAGATFVDDWDASGAGMPYRFVTFADRTVTDHPARVSTHVFQYADGSLAGSGDDAPGIAVIEAGVQPLNSDQARELAGLCWPPPPGSTG
ncbi:hypothetical protein [Mycobacterium sp.]|uniref:hypothetical protein n=1 Tax=Mycobacterium sp. TaxID=1785 RepID=UPI003C7568B7